MLDQLEKISLIPPNGQKCVLLHSCCAPCTGIIIERLIASGFDCTLFFYNPNVHPRKEYELRKASIKTFAQKKNITCLDPEYDPKNWLRRVRGLENEPERGSRCTKCFDIRLDLAAFYAHENNYPVFATSCGIARWKDMEQVNACGSKAASKYPGLIFWDFSWRKHDGSVGMYEVAKREKFYKQEYCGCLYSFKKANQRRKENGEGKIKPGLQYYEKKHVKQFSNLMIAKETLKSLKCWFADYTKTFFLDDPLYQRDINLKIDHTYRVCTEIRRLGESLNLNNEELNLAEATALFHDIGRFEQYARHRTYVDMKSENHAILGIEVLLKNKVFDSVDPQLKQIILDAIKYHNWAKLPKTLKEPALFYAKLLRDADKLDIWRLATDYYSTSSGERNKTLELNLPDRPEISEGVFSDLLAEEIVKAEHLKTLNDFKLLQMGWVYDLNFRRAFQLVHERGYLKMLLNSLPMNDMAQKIYTKIEFFLSEKCQEQLLVE